MGVGRVVLVLVVAVVWAGCGEDDPSSNNGGPGLDGGSDSGMTSPVPNSSAPDVGVADVGGETEDAGVDMSPGDMGGADMSAADMGAGDMGADAGAPDMSAADMGVPTFDTCEGAIDVTGGGSFTGTTSGENDDYGPRSAANGCPRGGTASGNDVVYSVSPAVDTTYDFVVIPDGNYDPMLYILTDCANDSVCAAGTVLNGPGTQESLNGFQAIGGTTYYVIVDGEIVSSGSYTLEVTLP